jgi:hypothetical protein
MASEVQFYCSEVNTVHAVFLLNLKLFVVVSRLHVAGFGPSLAWSLRFELISSPLVSAVNCNVRLLNFFLYESGVPPVVMTSLTAFSQPSSDISRHLLYCG